MKIKILALCCFLNQFKEEYQVDMIDIKHGKDVLDLPDEYGKTYDYILSAPPCNQFTVANNRNWKIYPDNEIKIAEKCLKISITSNKPWILETTIGRIDKLIPWIKQYRIGIWQSKETYKRHTLYSNQMLMMPIQKGNKSITKIRSVIYRETWQKDLDIVLHIYFSSLIYPQLDIYSLLKYK